MPLKIKNVNIVGFCAATMPPQTYGFILCKAKMSSDVPMFHRYVEQVAGMVFGPPANILPDEVFAMGLVIHADRTAHLYLNRELKPVARIRAKRTTAKPGEMIYLNDIADIVLYKPDMQIAPGDSVFYCWKVGWKFGLWFDFTGKVDVPAMHKELGTLYRRLSFEHLFKAIENAPQFADMLTDGWFPFVELLPVEYDRLALTYADRVTFDARIMEVVKLFTPERIDKVSARWWSSSVFAAKRPILEAGLEAYKQGTQSGYINAYRNLAMEIEGIMRAQHATDTGAPVGGKVDKFIEHIIAKERAKETPDDSLLLPGHFLTYLKEYIFDDFKVAIGELPMSRNLSGHGLAKPEDYTAARALQVVLTLDQLWFYSGDDNPETEPSETEALPETESPK